MSQTSVSKFTQFNIGTFYRNYLCQPDLQINSSIYSFSLTSFTANRVIKEYISRAVKIWKYLVYLSKRYSIVILIYSAAAEIAKTSLEMVFYVGISMTGEE